MALEAPAGTRCLIAQQTTNSDPRAVASKNHSVYAVENSWYMIQVKISTPYWREVPCSVRKEVDNFKKLSSAEARDFFSDKNLPYKGIPTVISVSETDTLHIENN
ncbi:hypothetical protein EIP86_006754 [Pleurotus ostreatoroseus]|nr:hypothetical protein EIP86_006754 [Pleurotus ostreatoroseus]